jgi:hypothetical protein
MESTGSAGSTATHNAANVKERETTRDSLNEDRIDVDEDEHVDLLIGERPLQYVNSWKAIFVLRLCSSFGEWTGFARDTSAVLRGN